MYAFPSWIFNNDKLESPPIMDVPRRTNVPVPPSLPENTEIVNVDRTAFEPVSGIHGHIFSTLQLSL